MDKESSENKIDDLNKEAWEVRVSVGNLGEPGPYSEGCVTFLSVPSFSSIGGHHGRQDDHCCVHSLALMQIQVNALLLLLERHTPGVPIKEDFQRLISEGVETVGIETMESIKNRIREGIIQQDHGENGNAHP